MLHRRPKEAIPSSFFNTSWSTLFSKIDPSISLSMKRDRSRNETSVSKVMHHQPKSFYAQDRLPNLGIVVRSPPRNEK
jgi:hypothetical protein